MPPFPEKKEELLISSAKLTRFGFCSKKENSNCSISVFFFFCQKSWKKRLENGDARLSTWRLLVQGKSGNDFGFIDSSYEECIAYPGIWKLALRGGKSPYLILRAVIFLLDISPMLLISCADISYWLR